MESLERLVTEQDEPVMYDETKCQFEIEEAKGILASLSLTSVTFEDYLIVLRSEFDVNILGQPYLALMLIFNVRSGMYSNITLFFMIKTNISHLIIIDLEYRVTMVVGDMGWVDSDLRCSPVCPILLGQMRI